LDFFAENIREHLVERHKAKEYISSLVGNLGNNTAKVAYLSAGLYNE
jgi:hypothetical protein